MNKDNKSEIKNKHLKLSDLYFKLMNVMYYYQYNSFNKFITQDIIEYLKNTDTTFFQKNDENKIIRYSLEFLEVKCSLPKTETIPELFPREARDSNLSYTAEISAMVNEIQEITDAISHTTTKTKINKEPVKVVLVNMPIMVRSQYCILNNINRVIDQQKAIQELKMECDYDPGCYFIINGSEKVVVSQERRVLNKPVISKPKIGTKEYEIKIDSVSPYNNGIMQVMGLKYYLNNGIIKLYNPLFDEFNIIILFRAMGIESDEEIINMCTLNASDKIKFKMIQILSNCIRNCIDDKTGDKLDTKDKCINYMTQHLRNDNRKYSPDLNIQLQEKKMEVDKRIKHLSLPHITNGSYQKIKFIGYMVFKLLNCYLGYWPYDDIDSLINKRIELVGDLFLQLFKQNFKKILTDLKNSFIKLTNADGNPVDITHSISQSSQNNQNKAFSTALSIGKFISRPGVAQQLPRLTYEQEQLLLREIVSPSKRQTSSRLYEPRMFHYTQNGMLCSMETPEHKDVGMIKHLTIISNITINHKEQIPIIKGFINKYIENNINDIRVFLNGDWIGDCNIKNLDLMLKTLKEAKLNNKIEKTTSISYNDLTGEVFIWCDGGRFIRPVITVNNNKSNLDKISIEELDKYLNNPNKYLDDFMIEHPGIIEFIDCDEQNNSLIAVSPKDLEQNNKIYIDDKDVDINNHYKGIFKNYTHLEIHPSLLLGINTSTVPFVNHNSGARTIIHYAQGKQGLTIYNSAYKYRLDKAFLLYHPHKPLLSTHAMKYSYYDILSPGENIIIAVSSFTGFNQDDGLIINQSAIDRGLFNACYFDKYISKCSKNSANGENDKFIKPNPAITSDMMRYGNYDKLNNLGYVPEETIINNNDVIIGKVSSISNIEDNNGKIWKDNSQTYKHYLPAVVDKVWNNLHNIDGYEIKKIKVRTPLKPMVGDKFSTKSAQKGTICLILPEEDMPYTENGLIPDIIFHPTGIYNRLTIGFLLELLYGKVSAIEGHRFDATGFEDINIDEIRNNLIKYGYKSSCCETMYNGMTGEKMESEILIAPLYYLRLKHLVADKVHGRFEGPKTSLVHQPSEGRSRDGGLKIGTMERDVLVAHGVSSFLKEKMLNDSDIYTTYICGNCGTIATRLKKYQQLNKPSNDDIYVCNNCKNNNNIHKVIIPYALKLTLQEFQAMNIGCKLGLDDNKDMILIKNDE